MYEYSNENEFQAFQVQLAIKFKLNFEVFHMMRKEILISK